MGNDRDPQLDLNRPGIIPLYADDENHLIPMMRSTDPVCVFDQSDCDSVEHEVQSEFTNAAMTPVSTMMLLLGLDSRNLALKTESVLTI